MSDVTRAIAFYLPQYHPIPENDQHWGTGFTEWNNVVRAKPLFPGHHQPHLPADLGFYDLRVPETRALQCNLAASSGISAFALYHYWFSGKRLMQRPVKDFFSDPLRSTKYLLCWANESWTLEWRGADNWTTIPQEYSEEDDWHHCELLAEEYLANDRYFRYEGRPVFLVYNPLHLPDYGRMIRILKDVCRAHGIDPLVGGCVAFEEEDIRTRGFDFSVRWAPNWLRLGSETVDERMMIGLRAASRLLTRRWPRFRHAEAHRYDKVIREHTRWPKPDWPTCETAFPSWDNSARRAHGDAILVSHVSGRLFRDWLLQLHERLRPEDPALVFVNAWNEWAEGCHLEPDDRWGDTWLKVCAEIFRPA